MNYFIYIIVACTSVFALATALLYHFDKYRLAKDAKMVAAMLFVALGAMCCAKAKATPQACMVIFAGFFPSYLGDYFLAKKEYPLDEKSDYFNFVSGVSCFGAAQLMYLIGFAYAANWQLSPYLIPLCAYSLIPTLGGMASGMISVSKNKRFIMIAYGFLLSFTLYTAASRYYLFPSTGSLLAMIGAISFCLSDSVLGMYYFGNIKINKKWLNYPIMLLYFLAQILYALSFIYA